MTTETPTGLTRLSVNINRETVANLNHLSDKYGATRTEIVRRALAVMKFIEDEMDKGREFYTEDPRDGTRRFFVRV